MAMLGGPMDTEGRVAAAGGGAPGAAGARAPRLAAAATPPAAAPPISAARTAHLRRAGPILIWGRTLDPDL
ncbi:MAG: hypothetical protein NTX13_15410 [Acidobacteria bacterium]|nr:hypothetical protein [Acidobacteriota bacterium]